VLLLSASRRNLRNSELKLQDIVCGKVYASKVIIGTDTSACVCPQEISNWSVRSVAPRPWIVLVVAKHGPRVKLTKKRANALSIGASVQSRWKELLVISPELLLVLWLMNMDWSSGMAFPL
jgi:hypothetical protein